MEMSEQINELAAALAKAQGKITGALKDSANPFFKSRYADLASCWDAAREHLSANGLCIIQTESVTDEGVHITTVLAHSSGQWIRETLRLIPKDSTPQGIGSCITYGRRYSFASFVGVAQIDDDGNQASGRDKHDPRGEQLSFDTKEKDKYVSRFLDAFNADLEDEAMARAIYGIHSEIANKHDLYIAVADELGTKHKSAIKAYVKQHTEAQKRGAQEVRDAQAMRQ